MFKVFQVDDQDNVRMSKFVEEANKCFDNERVFYEVCADEDLLFCKDVYLLEGKGIWKVINNIT